MNEKIDLTKILKDCPKGFELYSTVLGYVFFKRIDDCAIYPIVVSCKNGNVENFTNDGKIIIDYDGECTLFPSKEQRDWNKFSAPWYKKEMGIIARIEKQCEQSSSPINERAWLYLVSDVLTWQDGIGQYLDDSRVQELAKKLCSKYAQKLYNHSVISNSSNTGKNKQKSTDKVEPKFKVGDRIRHKETNKDDVYEISKVYDDSYGIAGFTWMIYMKYQDEYELVTNKFDPKTLKPFDRVLVRDYCNMEWSCDILSHIKQEDPFPYVGIGSEWKCCIPYNDDTKHLVGTTDAAPEFYR